jgi:hypothetical protein
VRLSWPAVIVALCVGVGFYYGMFAVISIASDNFWHFKLLGNTIVINDIRHGTTSVFSLLGSRLWLPELLVALLAAWAVIAWFGRVETRQRSNPRLDRGERAIWRLSYRRGNVLTLEQIQEFTLLDESTILATLRRLETKGEASLEPDGSWRLLEPNHTGPTLA